MKKMIYILSGFFLLLLLFASSSTAEDDGGYFEFIKRKIPLTTLIELPKGDGNAADIYWKVFMKYHNPELDNVLVRGYRESADPYSITWNSDDVRIIEEGATRQICLFSPTYWPYAAQFNDPVPSWIVLNAIMSALKDKGDILQGEAFNEDNPTKRAILLHQALQTYQKLIVFGLHIENERLSLTQVNMGGMIVNTGLEACYSYFTNINDEKNAALVLEMINDNKEYLKKLDEKSRSMVSSFDPRSAKPIVVNWDNIISVAEQDHDTLFRLEAISLLGAALYNFLPLENIDPELPDKFRQTMNKVLLRRTKLVLARLVMFDRDSVIQDAARKNLAASEIDILKKISFKEKAKRKGELKHSPWIPVYNF